MSVVSDRLAREGMSLPAAPAALGAYVPAVRAGSLVFTAGQLPLREGSLISSGLVDEQVSVTVARECAKQAALNALAAASTVCDLDEVSWAVKLVGYVASAHGFSDQPAVMNAASEVLTTAFGEAGAHAREAVGVAALPMDSPVELSLVLAL